MHGSEHGKLVLSALSEERTAKYLAQTGNNADRALSLYKWDSRLPAAMWSLISLFEVVLRNKLCDAIDAWSDSVTPPSNKQWVKEPKDNVREPLSKVSASIANSAKGKAAKAKELRDSGEGLIGGQHPRMGEPITRDDLIAQVTLTQWKENFFYRSPETQPDGEVKFFPDETRYNDLTRVYEAITEPALSAGPRPIDPDRASFLMHRINLLRNRIGHQESLIDIDCGRLRKEIFELLNCLDPAVLEHYSSNDPIPGILRDDPRKRRASS
ncbi:hypothetical protein KBX18_01505 [Corynebacterium sp. CCUG 69979]|uniref:hypothetical protein n=1 Tax=Corynebacterium sp. CCUG 69979 TaxID=2823890 RepID=UPI00210A2056|nr:hypothetical protein [Corynebacterium sp. CCUG 69979]MCQ4624246.1 hypothetical protein [Corynebacterium sp. CCUG 69979]